MPLPSPAALPTGRRGQAMALAIAVTLVLLVWTGVIAPLIDLYQEQAEGLNRKTLKAATMARLADELPALKRRVEDTAKAGAPDRQTLSAATDAVAAAQLQNRIQELSVAGVSLSSTEILPAANAGRYRRIGLKLSLDASWPALIALLQALERASPPILIDDLQIHAGSSPAASVPLRASLVIYGFRAVEASP